MFHTWSMMRRGLVAFAFGVLLAACASNSEAPMTVVDDFQTERYLGEWHQVAAIPAWFQRDCVADTTAAYDRAEDGLIEVINKCATADGSLDEADGRARFQGAPSEAKLEVTFVEVLGAWLWVAGGDYWVIGLDPDYAWSVVGHPSRDYGWILARSPDLDPATLATVGGVLTENGYDTCALIMTTPEQSGPLCEWL